MSRILIAGIGNELCQDDGFGIALARRFSQTAAGPEVDVYEAGIAGIALVQEMMSGYDALILLDAVDRGQPPGTLFVLQSETPDLIDWSEGERREFLADSHYTNISKALVLARAMHVLPERVYILGCQPESCELGMGLTAPVENVLGEALAKLNDLVTQFEMSGEVNVSGHPA